MDTKEFYYKLPKRYRGKIVQLPKHPELKAYENHDINLRVPIDANYLILTQIGILNPTISYYDENGYPTAPADFGNHIFTDVLEKKLGLIFERVENVPER